MFSDFWRRAPLLKGNLVCETWALQAKSQLWKFKPGDGLGFVKDHVHVRSWTADVIALTDPWGWGPACPAGHAIVLLGETAETKSRETKRKSALWAAMERKNGDLGLMGEKNSVQERAAPHGVPGNGENMEAKM